MLKRDWKISSFIEKATAKIGNSVDYMNLITRQDPREFELLDLDFVVKMLKAKLKENYRVSFKTGAIPDSQIFASMRLLESMFSLFKMYFDAIGLKNKSITSFTHSSETKLVTKITYNRRGSEQRPVVDVYKGDYVPLALCAIAELSAMLRGSIKRGAFEDGKETLIIEIPIYPGFKH